MSLYQVKTHWNRINTLKYFPVIQMGKSTDNYNFPNHRISTNMHYMIYTCVHQLVINEQWNKFSPCLDGSEFCDIVLSPYIH